MHSLYAKDDSYIMRIFKPKNVLIISARLYGCLSLQKTPDPKAEV